MVNIKNFILIYFSKIWRKSLYFLFGIEIFYNYKPLYGYFHYTKKKPDRLALLSYRVLQLREQSKKTWSSAGDTHDIIQALSELGYKTDVVYSRDKIFLPTKKYDLFIGHEGYNFKSITDQLSKKIPKVLYATAAYWQALNNAEEKRLEDLYKRRGIMFNKERKINASEDEAAVLVDGIILLGNEDCLHTYPVMDKFFLLEGPSFLNKKIIDPVKKDFNTGKNNFLILSGSGNVHKGLDLLLEAFIQMPDKHLYICSKLDADFAKFYKKELFATKNIHYFGDIKLYGKEFYHLMNICNFLIFPSCSEGSPGSVADCMVQGLIPIVTKASHIDVDGLGFYLEPCTIDNIIKLTNQVSVYEEKWYKERNNLIQKVSAKRFSPELFRKKFKEYLIEIINRKNKVY